MKKIVIAFAVVLTATAVLAQQQPAATPAPEAGKLDEKTEKLVRSILPVCADMKIVRGELTQKLPAGLVGSVLRVQAPRPACEAQYLMAMAPISGDVYIGLPWVLSEDVEGKTIAEKLQNFAWKALQENFTAVIGSERTRNGLYPVTMWETTERGKVPLEGEVDPDAKIFFIGKFHKPEGDIAAERLKAFESFLADAPTKGAAKPEVTVVEFSDFECPSCKHASTYLDPIMEKYGNRVRYTRYDVPLLTMHPWAFAAAVAGRAIYRQKPEAFWDYKKQIYSNQDKLTAFTLDDFARGFAQDHDLDMKKYDADVASSALADEILKALGTAFSNDVRATPTYMINGVYVDPGDDGKALEPYVVSLLKK